jgi:hypothetical protein
MPRDDEGNYLEPGYCPDCGIAVDLDGDCPNPFCFGKLPLDEQVEELERLTS